VGTAIVTVNIATGALHANILFRGITKEGDTRVPFTVKFQTSHGSETRTVEESLILESPVSVSYARALFQIVLRDFFVFSNLFNTALSAAPQIPQCLRILKPNSGQLRLRHWLSEALTIWQVLIYSARSHPTRLDLILES
jgi:hypothetical protein